MVVMKDATQEREVVDKVTKMAAELIFSVDAHISLTHSGGKPYECDQCKYSSKTAQNLKTHKLTHSGEKPYACDQYKYSSALAQALIRHKLTLGGERLCHSEENCLVSLSKVKICPSQVHDFGNFWCDLW